MAYVSDEILNETPSQSSTAIICDTPNAEVKNNEIKIGTVERQVRQAEEPGVKNQKKTMREVELSVIANVKKNLQSENNKLLASTNFLVAEMLGQKVRKVEKNRIGKDGQKVMLKPGRNIFVSQQSFAKGIRYYVKKTNIVDS